MVNETGRDYLAEARAILEGSTMILPERIHLLALELAHTREIIGICTDVRRRIGEVEEALK